MRRIGILGASPYSDADQDGIRAAVVSCATLVEAHVDRVLKALFVADAAMSFGLTRVLHAEIEDSIYRTWEARRRWLATAFDVSVSGDRAAQEFDVVVALRNSIVHGDGRLTDLQVGKFKELFRLKDQYARVLSAKVIGRRVALSPLVAVKAAMVSRDFVLYFDKVLLGRFPALTVHAS